MGFTCSSACKSEISGLQSPVGFDLVENLGGSGSYEHRIYITYICVDKGADRPVHAVATCTS